MCSGTNAVFPVYMLLWYQVLLFYQPTDLVLGTLTLNDRKESSLYHDTCNTMKKFVKIILIKQHTIRNLITCGYHGNIDQYFLESIFISALDLSSTLFCIKYSKILTVHFAMNYVGKEGLV